MVYSSLQLLQTTSLNFHILSSLGKEALRLDLVFCTSRLPTAVGPTEDFWLLQVSALALCKHNKNSMLLKYLTTRWRHSRADKIFWDYDKVQACHQLLYFGRTSKQEESEA